MAPIQKRWPEFPIDSKIHSDRTLPPCLESASRTFPRETAQAVESARHATSRKWRLTS